MCKKECGDNMVIVSVRFIWQWSEDHTRVFLCLSAQMQRRLRYNSSQLKQTLPAQAVCGKSAIAIFCAGWLRRQNLDLRNLNSVLLCVILYYASFSSAWTEVSSLAQREFWSAAIRQKRNFSLLPNHNTYPASNPDVRLSLYNSWNMNTVTIQGILT